MFILRKISGDGIQMNFSLGKHYVLTTRDNAEEFKKLSLAFWDKEDPEETYGYISDQEGNLHALFNGQFNYIMTQSGATFANVSEVMKYKD